MEIGLLIVLAGLALATCGTRVVGKQVERAWSLRLEDAAVRGVRGPLRALLTGIVIGFLVPRCASAMRLCWSQSYRLDRRPAMLAPMLLGLPLGAGAAAALLLLAAPVAAPLVAGVAAVMSFGSRRPRTRALGTALGGVALLLLAANLLALAAPWATTAHAGLPAAIRDDVFVALAAGAAATFVLRSGTCCLLVLAALATAGLPTATAVALGIGAALAGALLAFRANDREPAAREVAGSVLAITGAAALAGLCVLEALALPPSPWNLLVAHLTCAAGAAAIGQALRSGDRFIARAGSHGNSAEEADAARAIDGAGVVLADLTRELARLAEHVEHRLGQGFRAFVRGHQEALPDEGCAHARYLQIKRRLTALPPCGPTPAVGLRAQEVLAAAVMLERVAAGTTVFLRCLEQWTRRTGTAIPAEPLAEICSLHALAMHNLRLAAALAVERTPQLARGLAEADAPFLALEAGYRAAHLERLARAAGGDLLASATHLDILGELRGINLQVCALGRTFLQLQAHAGAVLRTRHPRDRGHTSLPSPST